MHTGFWWGDLREGDHLEDLDVDGRIILKWILQEIGCNGVDWIDMAQHKNKWQGILQTATNL
jgi:hypothetical protein